MSEINSRSTPKKSTPNWKGSLTKLFSCGSGKKDHDDKKNAPTTMAPALMSLEENDADINHEIVTTKATPGHGNSNEEVEISYTDVKEIGKGTFGVVYRAKMVDTGELVAIKRVFHDERYKNRELQMMTRLRHPNILELKYYFHSRGERYKSNELYLNMVLDYLPETLYSYAKCDGTKQPLLDVLLVKVYMYQIFRALAYLHALGICHRDVKPQNMLLNSQTCVIKLCDFGSAKELLHGEANIAYICSRYYRAPELVLGTTNYNQQIDVWSAGCVLGELLLGQPIFPGANGPDQLVEIIKVLGTPTMEDVFEINPNYSDFRFPHLLPHPWTKILKPQTDRDAIDLLSQLLVFAPSRRLPPIEACLHHFFDALRNSHTRLPNGRRLPPLFTFTEEELSISPDIKSRLIPADYVEGQDQLDDPMVDSFMMNNSSTKQTTGRQSLLGRIGSLQTSFKGIKLTPSSSGKKKNKQQSSGIEDDVELHMSPIPATFNFSSNPTDDVDHADYMNGNLAERRESAEVHSEPEEIAVVHPHLGVHDGSIPRHYQAEIDRDEEGVDMDNVGGLQAEPPRSSGKKKKKKVTKPKTTAPVAYEGEQSIESSSFMESDGMGAPDARYENTPAARTRPKKGKKPIASTPTFDEPKSFDASPPATPPPPSRHHPGEALDDIEPLPPAPDGDQEVRVVKKKRPKVAKKPAKKPATYDDADMSDEGLNDSRHANTEI